MEEILMKKYYYNSLCKSFLGSKGNFLKKLYFDESGAVTTEYVIITGLLALALIGAASALADATRLWFWRKVLRIIKY